MSPSDAEHSILSALVTSVRRHHPHLQGADAKVKTLNYAPGPLDTDMQRDFREGLLDDKLRAAFQEMHAKVRKQRREKEDDDTCSFWVSSKPCPGSSLSHSGTAAVLSRALWCNAMTRQTRWYICC